MPDQPELLNIVDETDEVIGVDTRENIHRLGLLHREIHIWFYTPTHHIIFQHRAKTKKGHPDKLDATVGGHVALNMSYEETVFKEALEETGIHLIPDKLIFLSKIHSFHTELATGMINYAFRSRFMYLFDQF